jgi:hypothetical protein
VRELIRSNGINSKARLKLVRRPATSYGSGALPQVDAPRFPSAIVPEAAGDGCGAPASVRDRRDDGCLIFSRDTVISRGLQEETRIVLAMLTPRERLVLRLRFGIAQTGDHPLEMIDEVLTPVQMDFIEATALRKLRHPSQVARLRSVDRR